MKFLNILFTVFVLCLVCTLTFGEEETPKRGALLLRRPGARAGPLGKSTTTTAAPKEDEELGDEEYDQSEDLDEVEKEQDESAAASPTTTTTTEPPKKIGPIIRPFRSNDDLLLALKRRQMNSKKGASKVEKPIVKLESEGSEKEESSAPAPASKSSVSDRTSRRKFGGSKSPNESEESSAQADDLPAKKPSRFALRPSRSN